LCLLWSFHHLQSPQAISSLAVVSQTCLSLAIIPSPAIVESGYIAYNSHSPSLIIFVILLPFCSNLICS
jgi:hypothetical protein